MDRFENVESRLTIGLLVVLLAFSLVSAVFSIDARWLTPALLLAVLLVLRIVWPLSSLRGDIEKMQEGVQQLVSDSEFARVKLYTSADEFFSEAQARVEDASDSVYLTYLRQRRPDRAGSEAATAYFEAVLDWARANDAHTVRRIIGRQAQPEFQTWLEGQVAIAKEIPNYRVRLLDWPLDADAINMAIIDKQFTFLLIAGDQPGKLRGLSVRSSDAAVYFCDYHAGLWDCAQDP